jgi:hypothetical protein
MSTSEKVLESLGLTGAGNGTFRVNAPYRPTSDSKSLVVSITGPEAGRWYDHVEKTGGSLYQLAERLGVSISRGDGRKRVPTMKEYAEEHGVTEEILRAYGWTPDYRSIDGTRYGAMRFTTATGNRWRILDAAAKRKYTHDRGYQSCWYRLDAAIAIANANNEALVLCNGEVSTVVAQHYGIAATCATSSGERALSASLLEALTKAWKGKILIALDCDDTGVKAMRTLLAQLRGADYDVRAIDLRMGHKGDLADFCSLYQNEARDAFARCDELPAEVAMSQWGSIGVLASDLQHVERKPPRWIVPGILTQGACLLAGAPKSRKSWMAAQLAWSVASGGTVFGPDIHCTQGDVLYLDLEMMRDNTASRFDAMSERDQMWPSRLRVVTIEDDWPKGDEGMALIESWCQDHPERALVIIDVLANMRSARQKGENLYEEDLAFTQSINKIAEKYRIAIIGVVHTRKMADANKANMISGSTGMTGGVAMSMVLTKSPDNDMMNELYREGRHLINSEPLALKWHPYHARHILEGPVIEVALSLERKRLLDIMRAGDEWQVKDLALEMQKSDSTVHAMLQWLLSQALIEKVGRGRYAIRRKKDWIGQLTQTIGHTGNVGNDGNVEMNNSISVISEIVQNGVGNDAGLTNAPNTGQNGHFRKFDDIAIGTIVAPQPLGALGWVWRDIDGPAFASINATYKAEIRRIRDTAPDDAREQLMSIMELCKTSYLDLFHRKA